MRVRRGVVVHLGYGKYFRADQITGLEPIEENRGPGRRTYVYVKGRSDPIIASRTETTILRDMVEEPGEVMEARQALALLEDIAGDLSEVGPMLRGSILEEAGLNLNSWERRIESVLTGVDGPETIS